MEYVIPPAGCTAASVWTPVPFVDPAKPPTFLSDRLDASTGEMSLLEGMDPVDAWMVTQVRTVEGSGAAVFGQGQRLPPNNPAIELNTADAAQLIKFELRRVFKPAVDRGDVEIVDIVVNAGDDGPDLDYGAGLVLYRNLRRKPTDPKNNRADPTPLPFSFTPAV